MGGDEYVEITHVRKIGIFIFWKAYNAAVGEIKDRVVDTQIMRIKASS